MAVPILAPSTAISTIVLPVTGTLSKAQAITSYPLGLYSESDSAFYDPNFVSGAIDQVSLTYRMLGGDVLDVELTEENVYTAYETSVLEYSYIVNIHQGKNALPSILGHTTGTFDHDGSLKAGDLSSSLSGEHVGLKYPKFDYASSRRASFRASHERRNCCKTRVQ